MFRDEIARRLAKGEEPLPLTVEMWKRKRKNFAAAKTLNHMLGHGNCPLCHVFYLKNHNCKGCPLYEAGLQCNTPESPYAAVYWQHCDLCMGEADEVNMLEAIDNLIKTLESLVEGGIA